MVRSMYSGVAGMKTHQTRLDVIGNNIANVNTYGYKSSRATFRDVYYQTMRGASAGSGNKGGINPTQIGYGSTFGSNDVLMTQSAMTNTGNPLDVAITGEGFLQVQDGDGNIFYTKAGMLDIDSAGNLVDVNGNFVLGVTGSPVGKAPSSDRIQFSIPSVQPSASEGVLDVNGVKLTVKSTNQTTDGNVSINFGTDATMPIGQKVKAVVTSSGVTVKLNPKEMFANAGELEAAMNNAITEANGGKEHPGGHFSLSVEPASKFANLTGAEICGGNFGFVKGKLPISDTTGGSLFGGFTVSNVGDEFLLGGTGGAPTYKLDHTPANATAVPPTEESFKLTVEVGGQTYEGTILASQMNSPGSIMLKCLTPAGRPTSDNITMTFPSLDTVKAAGGTPDAAGKITYADQVLTSVATPSTASKDLGFASNPVKMANGTKGGAQTVKDLTGIFIGPDGVISASHASLGTLELGRIDLAVFANSAGLMQAGNTYFTVSQNSGEPEAVQPGTSGSGELKSSSLELSNVDLSQEFSDMITTQRGFQANSRIITVSDTMLEELINLKR